MAVATSLCPVAASPLAERRFGNIGRSLVSGDLRKASGPACRARRSDVGRDARTSGQPGGRVSSVCQSSAHSQYLSRFVGRIVVATSRLPMLCGWSGVSGLQHVRWWLASAFASRSPGAVGERRERVSTRSIRGSAALGFRRSAASMPVRHGRGDTSEAPWAYAGSGGFRPVRASRLRALWGSFGDPEVHRQTQVHCTYVMWDPERHVLRSVSTRASCSVGSAGIVPAAATSR